MAKKRKKELFYGHSLKGKSKAIATLVKHLFETTGKKSRLYIGDGGVDTYLNMGLVEAGMLDVCEFGWRSGPSTALRAMSEFHMPNEKEKWLAPAPDFFETHGLVIYEGATVMRDWFLGDYSIRVGKGEQIGGVKDSDDTLVMQDIKNDNPGLPADFYEHGMTTGLHYTSIYAKIRTAIQKSFKFPGWVIWTAHPTEAPDATAGGRTGDHGKIIGKKIIGPDVCGKMQAATISRLFGNTLHFDTAIPTTALAKDETTQKQIRLIEPEYRIYTRTHNDPDAKEMTEFIAGSRVDGLKLYYQDESPGKAILDYYHDYQEQEQTVTKGEN